MLSKKIEEFVNILVQEPFNLDRDIAVQILKELRYVSPTHSDNDLATAGKLIVESGLLSEEGVTEALAKMDNVEYYDYFANADLVDRDLVKRFPPESYNFMRMYGFFPIETDDTIKEVKVGFKNASSIIAYNAARESLDLAGFEGFKIRKVLISNSALEDYIFYNLKKIEIKQIRDAINQINIEETNTNEGEAEEERNSIRNAFAMIIAKCIFDKVSDIHFEPKDLIGRIKVRKNGVLENFLTLDIKKYSILAKYLMNITVGVDSTARGKAQDGRIEDARFFNHLSTAYNINDVDFRVSILPNLTMNENNAEFSTESIVVRILSRRGGIPSLEKLGFNVFVKKTVKSIANKATGIFLITGPTGSGKTTTLYSILSRVNAIERNVITVEDPVEYRNPMWKQTQVRTHLGKGSEGENIYDFNSALVHILRHDPDVILLGEIRDRETAEQAFKAANTGHLVLTTLHTNDAPTAVLRLLDLGVDRFLLANTILAISAQRLIREVCSHCSVERNVTEEDNAFIEDQLRLKFKDKAKIERYKLSGTIKNRGEGCNRCGYRGYTKRTVISELVQFTTEVKERIIDGDYNSLYDIMIDQYPNNSLFLDGLDKVRHKMTTVEELKRVL